VEGGGFAKKKVFVKQAKKSKKTLKN